MALDIYPPTLLLDFFQTDQILLSFSEAKNLFLNGNSYFLIPHISGFIP